MFGATVSGHAAIPRVLFGWVLCSNRQWHSLHLIYRQAFVWNCGHTVTWCDRLQECGETCMVYTLC